jgi:hypothetical protein
MEQTDEMQRAERRQEEKNENTLRKQRKDGERKTGRQGDEEKTMKDRKGT